MALLEALARIRSQQAGGGSRAVLVRVIQPLLAELGWDVGDPFQVDLDHEGVDVVLSIPRGEQTSPSDRRPGRPGVYVRFVPSEREFSAQAAGLVAEAARDGADLCALTTGQIWQLYAAKPMQEADACRFARLDVRGDPAERVADELEMYLSREALIDQRAQRSAEHALTARLNAERVAAAIPNVWRRLLAGPDSLLVEYVQDEVRKETGLHAAAEQVIAVIRSEALASPPAALPEPRTVAEPPPASPSTGERQQSGRAVIAAPVKPTRKRGGAAGKRIVGFRLWGERHQTRTAKGMWLGVAESVHERHRHDFDRAFELRGRTRQYIARSPEALFSAEQIGTSPYFAEINFSSADCMRYARELLELFEYGADELEILYD